MDLPKFGSLFELYQYLRSIGPEQSKEFPVEISEEISDEFLSSAIRWYLDYIPGPYPQHMLDVIGENIDLFRDTYDLKIYEAWTERFVDFGPEMAHRG